MDIPTIHITRKQFEGMIIGNSSCKERPCRHLCSTGQWILYSDEGVFDCAVITLSDWSEKLDDPVLKPLDHDMELLRQAKIDAWNREQEDIGKAKLSEEERYAPRVSKHQSKKKCDKNKARRKRKQQRASRRRNRRK